MIKTISFEMFGLPSNTNRIIIEDYSTGLNTILFKMKPLVKKSIISVGDIKNGDLAIDAKSNDTLVVKNVIRGYEKRGFEFTGIKSDKLTFVKNSDVVLVPVGDVVSNEIKYRYGVEGVVGFSDISTLTLLPSISAYESEYTEKRDMLIRGRNLSVDTGFPFYKIISIKGSESYNLSCKVGEVSSGPISIEYKESNEEIRIKADCLKRGYKFLERHNGYLWFIKNDSTSSVALTNRGKLRIAYRGSDDGRRESIELSTITVAPDDRMLRSKSFVVLKDGYLSISDLTDDKLVTSISIISTVNLDVSDKELKLDDKIKIMVIDKKYEASISYLMRTEDYDNGEMSHTDIKSVETPPIPGDSVVNLDSRPYICVPSRVVKTIDISNE